MIPETKTNKELCEELVQTKEQLSKAQALINSLEDFLSKIESVCALEDNLPDALEKVIAEYGFFCENPSVEYYYDVSMGLED